MALAALALGVEVEQLAGELLRGLAGPALDRLPAAAAELGERRVGSAAADVAADLGQLVDGHEDLVRARVLEVEVVAGDVGDRLGVKAGEAGDAVVLVDDDVAGAQVGEGPQHAAPARAPAATGRALRAAAGEQPLLGDDREVELGRDEALGEPGLDEGEGARGLAILVAEPVDLHPPEVVGEALPDPALGEGDDGPVTGAGQLLELGLGLLEAARGDVGGLGAELERLILVDAREADLDPLVEHGEHALGVDVEVPGVGAGQRGRDVLPVVGERRREVLGAGDQHRRLFADQLEQRVEAVDGEQLGDVGPVGGLLHRGDLGQLSVLGRELGGGRDLDALGVAQRALGEGGEPAQRLDLVAEQVDADGPVLGGGKEVEQAAADGELAAVLDLVDALVAGRDELERRLVEVDQVADAQHEPVRAHRALGDLLRESDRGDDDHRCAGAGVGDLVGLEQ